MGRPTCFDFYGGTPEFPDVICIIREIVSRDRQLRSVFDRFWLAVWLHYLNADSSADTTAGCGVVPALAALFCDLATATDRYSARRAATKWCTETAAFQRGKTKIVGDGFRNRRNYRARTSWLEH